MDGNGHIMRVIATIVCVIIAIIILNSYLFDFSPFTTNIKLLNSKSQLSSNQLKFYTVYEKWFPICGYRNEIMNRGDGYGVLRNETFRKTPWSMSSIEIQYFINSSLRLQNCKHLSEALLSISLPPIAQTCSLSWMSSEDIGRILRKYSYIILNGNRYSSIVLSLNYFLLTV